MNGFVYLIGAGCGDADLLTQRGLTALKRCDTVIYDALIDDRILSLVPDAEQIPVGKRAGKHSTPQDEINRLLVERASAGRHVARLKGGDPFVFGRGGEEILALKEAGIPYSVIPGISSAIAVPELAGIPVTHREISRSLHIITAHTAEGRANFSRYAALEGTLVFLMGLSALPQIAADLIAGGMPNTTPAAVISEGGTLRQRTVRGTLSDISARADAAHIVPPAVIVIGQTAEFDFSKTLQLPLGGVSVTVAGTAAFLSRVEQVLSAQDADVYPLPHICVTKKDDIPLLSGYGCIVLTGRNGAAQFLAHLRETKTDFRSLSGIKLAVIGSGTASVLEQAGLYPEIIPAQFTSEALAEAVAEQGAGRVLLLRAVRGSAALPEILSQRGIAFDDVRIYDTAPNPEVKPHQIDTDFLVFGSAFGVESFFAQGYTVSPETKIISIGDKTAAAVKRAGCETLAAHPHTAEGIAQAIIEEVQGK